MTLQAEHIEAVSRAADKIHDAAVMLTSNPTPPPPVSGGVQNIMMSPPTNDERAVHRVEKKHAQMVVLNICMGIALVLNWFTDTNQSYVINAIYMMAPDLQKQIEAKKEAQK